uniref:30S ribosomal protein S10, chloroplastic n=1 Tax=Pleurostichidium falkenbergii TaxID=121064 RepID=A0A4D6UV32_9FLOR|nr:ribosomal protein S10 [Pleurostichidium falkenbergii]QCH39722.1 ribosomal protein S10 [Pleurostichidium falkenbergii]
MNSLKNSKVRIKLKTYENQLLKESCNNIINTIKNTEAQIIGPISMPTKRKIYCVLRSPHVDKDSREHFEIRIYTKLIDVYKPSSKTVDALMKLNIPAGVDIEVKI